MCEKFADYMKVIYVAWQIISDKHVPNQEKKNSFFNNTVIIKGQFVSSVKVIQL